MKHIKSIQIKGFQSHHHSYLELDPGLNVITGPSDSGKTAIIRSLRWAAYNEPTGESFINDQIGQASVVTCIGDTTIHRARGKGVNFYEHNNQLYEGFGVNTPTEITAAHAMQKAEVGEWKQSLNIAFQMDPPFLLTESAGQAAKVLGYLAGTEVIDQASKDTNSDLYRHRQEKNSLELQIKSAKLSLEEYEHLDDWASRILQLERTLNRLEEIEAQMKTMAELHLRYKQNLDASFPLAEVLIKTGFVYALAKFIPSIAQGLTRSAALESVAIRDFKNRTNINSVLKELDKLNPSNLADCTEIISDGRSAISRQGSMYALREDIVVTEADIIRWKSVLKFTGDIGQGAGCLEKAMQQRDIYNQLSLLCIRMTRNLQDSSNIERALYTYQNLDLAEVGVGTGPAHIQKLNQLQSLKTAFSNATHRLQTAKFSFAEAEMDFDFCTGELRTTLKELGKCPVCYADITQDKINQIIGGM